MKSEWKRVNRQCPCPVCEKPDWCLYTGSDVAPTAAICARIESEKQCGEAGWLHVLRDDGPAWPAWRRTIHTAAATMTPPATSEALTKIADSAAASTAPELLERLVGNLGVSVDSLRRLSVGWLPGRRAWSFPMRSADGMITGIRLRYWNGKKLSVKGGKEGLFLPRDLQLGGRLLICEGPTDTAALLDLGFSVVGRPSCSGGVKHLVKLAQRLEPDDAVVVADDDGPGRRGADNLAEKLLAYVPTVRVITPPAKDARVWVRHGATLSDVETAIGEVDSRVLRIRVCSR